MLRSFKYRLLPTEDQAALIDKHINYCRFVYNLALETKIYAWKSASKTLSCYDLTKQLTELKNTDCKWLNEVTAMSLESSVAHLDFAYKSFFKGGGFPKFKKKTNFGSVTFRQGCKVDNDLVFLPKIKYVKFIKHREIADGEIRTTVVSKTPTGRYFVSILIKCEAEIPEKKPVIADTSVGVDIGVKTFAVLSDGISYGNPKYLQESLTRLKKELRTLSRRYQRSKKVNEQSKGWHKQKMVVAKVYEKIYNKRKDFAHKISSEIIKRYDTVFTEDLNISGMKQNKTLSKAVSDAGWSQFMDFLKYKADWSGKNVVEIGRFQPSSKACSICDAVNKDLTLSDREWTCNACGATHDRDQNAAINIKKIGLKSVRTISNEDEQ